MTIIYRIFLGGTATRLPPPRNICIEFRTWFEHVWSDLQLSSYKNVYPRQSLARATKVMLLTICNKLGFCTKAAMFWEPTEVE